MERTPPELTDLTSDLVDRLAERLPPGTLQPVEPRYLEEPRRKWQGRGNAVARPVSVADVSTLLAFCNDHRIGVIPYGGGTGLVGAQVKPEGPRALIVSMERMAAVRSIQPEDDTLVAEAGVTLHSVQQAAAEAGRLFPLSLASEGTCQLGGNLATNAGGVQVLNYGNARDLVLGVEAVLADGTVVNGLKRLRKDNTGYDLRHLLIGSEGTLGIITAASLRLFPVPEERVTAFLQIAGAAASVALLSRLKAALPGRITAFELIDRTGFDMLAEELPDVRRPFSQPSRWMALVEISGALGDNLPTRVEVAIADAVEAGLVLDGLVAQNDTQRREFWTVRESIPAANRMVGAVASHDVSVPVAAIPDLIQAASSSVLALGDFRINAFGHVGDGNLHFNVYPPRGRRREEFLHLADRVTRVVHETVHRLDGSISAEHGIGRLKVADLRTYGDPGKLAAMRAIKDALDPNGILNPGAVLG